MFSNGNPDFGHIFKRKTKIMSPRKGKLNIHDYIFNKNI